jgi:non-canonical (house-cleaning) NTP pyrophosphatase
MTDAETRRGAVNRAKGALEAYKAANGGVSPDYAVGLVSLREIKEQAWNKQQVAVAPVLGVSFL